MTHVCAVAGDDSAEVSDLFAALVSRRTKAASEGKPSTVPEGGNSEDRQHNQVEVTIATGSTAHIEYHHCVTPYDLFTLSPAVVLLAFSPLDPASAPRLLRMWGPELDRLSPRPKVCIVATRLEHLSNAKIVAQMKADSVTVLTPDECVELAADLRAVSYTEVAISTGTNIPQLEASIAKAALGDADRRPTIAHIEAQRAECVLSGKRLNRAKWVARRDKATNRIFYFNLETKHSQWARPSDFDGQEPDMTEEEKAALRAELAMDEETRRRNEREAERTAAYMRDVLRHDATMRDLREKSDLLNTQIGQLQGELRTLREMERKSASERELLEQRREEITKLSSEVVEEVVEEDVAMDTEIQRARSKAYQLEASAALRADREFDVHITEALMKHRSLAAKLRALLQEQLEVQKSGSLAQAKLEALQHQKENATHSLAKLQLRLTKLDQEKVAQRDACEAALLRQRALESEVELLRKNVTDVELAPSDALRQQENLIRACQDIQTRIDAARRSLASVDDTSRENQRLLIEQRSLIQRLAVAEAARTQTEIHVRKLVIKHAHSCDERRAVEDRLLHLAEMRYRKSLEALKRLEEGSAYRGGVSHEELHSLVDFMSPGRIPSKLLKGKLSASEQAMNLRAQVRQYYEFFRDRRSEVNAESAREKAINRSIVSVFDQIPAGTADSTKAITGILDRARSCLVQNAELLTLLKTSYQKHLESDVDAEKVTPTKRRFIEPASLVGYPRQTGAAAVDSPRQSYKRLADRIATRMLLQRDKRTRRDTG